MTRRSDDPAAGLREHTGPPGSAIVPTGPRDWRTRWSDAYCSGELRAMYVREAGEAPPRDLTKWRQDKAKTTWRRVGYVCLRCGVVELHDGILPLDERAVWNKANRKRRPAAVLAPGRAPFVMDRVECPDCGELQSVKNLERHRRRRHSPGAVDTTAAAPAAAPAVDTAGGPVAVSTGAELDGWAPGEIGEAYGR